jgi:hypothetical protein
MQHLKLFERVEPGPGEKLSFENFCPLLTKQAPRI